MKNATRLLVALLIVGNFAAAQAPPAGGSASRLGTLTERPAARPRSNPGAAVLTPASPSGVVQPQPCQNTAQPIQLPPLLDEEDMGRLRSANAALTATLASIGLEAETPDAGIDAQLYANAMQLAQFVDRICPNGECIVNPAVEDGADQ